MLILMCRVGDHRFALDSRVVREVLPRVDLESVPRSPDWVSGLFVHRGRMTPVVDLTRLIVGQEPPRLLSNRIVLVKISYEGKPRSVGLLVERLTTEQFNAGDHALPEETPPTTAWGVMQCDPQGLFQLLDVQCVLNNDRVEMLFGRAGE